MYSKLSLAVVAALAAAGHAHKSAGKEAHASGIFPSGRPYQPSGSAPFPTGAPASGVFPTGTAAGTGTAGSGAAGAEPTGDSTLTYTIGSGDHTTVITTTIHHYNTHTDFVYASHTAAAGAGAGGDNGGPGQDSGASGAVTSTQYLTSTSTNFVTAYNGQTGAPGAPEKVGNAPAGASGAGGCAAASTITVQGPAVTITVTAAAAGGAATGGPNGGDTNSVAGPGQSQVSQIVPPYPIPSKKSKTKCASTGFITKSGVKPTGTGGATGVLPSGTGVAHPYPLAGSTAPIVKAKAYKN